MIALPISELQVDSDLQLDIDGVPARLVSAGEHLTLLTTDAGHLFSRMLETAPRVNTPLRGVLGELASTLDALGLSAAVVDDRGVVVSLGRGCGSRLGRLLLGSEHVRVGPVSVPVAASVVYGSTVVRRRLTYALGAGTLASFVTVAGLRRRRMR